METDLANPAQHADESMSPLLIGNR